MGITQSLAPDSLMPRGEKLQMVLLKGREMCRPRMSQESALGAQPALEPKFLRLGTREESGCGILQV